MDGRIDDLPVVAAGDVVELRAKFSQTELTRIVVDVLRPTGFLVASKEWHAL
jgi:hypothetical protein